MITTSPLPPDALLTRYAQAGAYTDCFVAQVGHRVSLATLVEVFYTGRLFKIERWLLRWLLDRPSTDAQARELALGERDSFAAWRVEARAPAQLLMCDVMGRTRSWLMVEQVQPGTTRLYFGSAVVPTLDRATGERRMGFVFAALLGFHKLYSRLLLGSARSRLENIQKQ